MKFTNHLLSICVGKLGGWIPEDSQWRGWSSLETAGACSVSYLVLTLQAEIHELKSPSSCVMPSTSSSCSLSGSLVQFSPRWACDSVKVTPKLSAGQLSSLLGGGRAIEGCCQNIYVPGLELGTWCSVPRGGWLDPQAHTRSLKECPTGQRLGRSLN